ncbi:type II toxin-antitoxin system RelE family toxin [Nostoc sp.]
MVIESESAVTGVIYDIFDDVLLVSVVKVAHRKQVYRDE